MAERENASPRLGNIGYFSCRGDERINRQIGKARLGSPNPHVLAFAFVAFDGYARQATEGKAK